MRLAPHPRALHGLTTGAAFAANADGTVRHYAPYLPAIARAILRDSDGLYFDNVEHVRQNRLKRWQTPADPTRRDAS